MIPVFIVLGVLALVVIFGGLYAYNQAFYAKGGKKNISGYFEKNTCYQRLKDVVDDLIKNMENDKYEDVYIKSYDGTRLYARYYHTKDNAPVHIMLHGYKGNALRDMCGGYRLARDMGHNVLVVDHRGCGKSCGRTITFGIKERRDALCWINYICSRFGDVPIFMVGVSMGAATSLMVTDMDIPKNVVGVIADCPYSSPKEVITKVCRDMGMPRFIYAFVVLGAMLYGGFLPNSASAVKSVQNSKVPILILHGDADAFVPFSMAEAIYKSATSEKYLYSFEGADHGMSYMVDPEKYTAAVNEFAQKCLNYRHSVDENKI